MGVEPTKLARRSVIVCAAALMALLPAACSSSGKKAATSGSPTTSGFLGGSGTTIGGSGGTARKAVPGTVRVVNLYAPGGKPQDIDLYDSNQTSPSVPKPVSADVKYGTVSPAFSLHVAASDTQTDAGLWATAAGKAPTSFRSFHQLDNIGFATDTDVLLVIADNGNNSDLSTDPLTDAATTDIYQTDPKHQHGGPTVSAPPSGKGIIDGVSFAFQEVKASDGSPAEVTYFVDGVCGAVTAKDESSTTLAVAPSTKGNVTGYLVTPGSHTVELFVSGSSTPLCSKMTPLVAKTSVPVTDGKVTYVFPYGTVAEPKLLVVPGD